MLEIPIQSVSNDRRISGLPAEQSPAHPDFITVAHENVMFLSCAFKAAAHAQRLIGIVSAPPLRFLTQLVPRPGGDSSVPTMLICARPGRPKRERAMRLEDVTLTLFAACNFIRLFAYLPQIYKAATDKNGASAISYTTWGLFLIAHLSTIAYALVNRSDWWLAACFTCNALCCIAILAVAYRRSLSHARTSPPTTTSLPGSRRSLSEYMKQFIPVRIGSATEVVRDGSRR